MTMRSICWALPVLLLSACGQESTPEAVEEAITEAAIEFESPVFEMEPSDSYKSAQAAAIAAIEEASAKGHAWTTSDQLIKDAAVAAAGGDEDAAIRLADEARWQAQLATVQADREAAVWRDNVIAD
jgi:hypothetical protein